MCCSIPLTARRAQETLDLLEPLLCIFLAVSDISFCLKAMQQSCICAFDKCAAGTLPVDGPRRALEFWAPNLALRLALLYFMLSCDWRYTSSPRTR